MRWTKFHLYTTREVPADAEVISHQLMLRTGMIKKTAAGIYTYMPFGWRSLQKLMTIVRRELDFSGALELQMPAVQPAELWMESGRWQKYGKELLRFKDRHDRDFCMGPTHEEVITDAVRRDLKSYRQLPVNLYQIQTKFRDEIRPRFGLMRGREFIMKDGYSFHASRESLDETYNEMEAAYRRIFDALKLDYTAVEADTGTIGGSASHEFMVLAETGESAVVRCPQCGYGANVEKAETRELSKVEPGKEEAMREVATPGSRTVDEVAKLLQIPGALILKTLIYNTEKGLVAVAIRGDREVNEIKLGNALDVQHLQLASDEKVREAIGASFGSLGPIGLPKDVPVLVDRSAESLRFFACGANQDGAHFVGVEWGRDIKPETFVDVLMVAAGDGCPRCEGTLGMHRGIEVGHIFKLGTKYSQAMQCNFTDEVGQDHPMVMGCYGLGVGRTVAAAIEQNHDADGIIWPLPLAPFQVLLQSLNPSDAAVSKTADELYAGLRAQGVDVLYDDRDERPGVKFKDGDLIGIPVRITVGAKSLADGKVEVSSRRERVKELVAVPEAIAGVMERLRASG
ncbi:MAG: proline--tRNA ligase [Acidobacteriota bacterium]